MIERVKEIDYDDTFLIKMMNEPILKTQELKMDSFLYHIFDQPLEEAARRPRSQHAKSREAYIMRHAFFEENIYSKKQFFKNQIYRMMNHTLLGRKRTK